MDFKEYSNYLIEYVGISEEVINCITGINGDSEETLNDVLYYYTGYRDLEQYTEYEDMVYEVLKEEF